ncbi:hypothetical protein C2G38_2253262 [Gigaspora rosea]|uniref:Ion transport domain-containing protein n=1 Tax=Gigaspora rosea TaxID=44941 RepID=A0A397UGT7_9GLOM|nr:hypothetical protein C2G38_2253262 [Gigaspora rosea]
MTSNSENSQVELQIEEPLDKNKQIEEPLDKNKKILEIVCSPNLKHVATLDEVINVNNINIWSINSYEGLLTHVKKIRIDNVRAKKNGERIFAISNNQCVSISLNRSDPYNFRKDNSNAWFCKSMIELKYFKKIYITSKGKLIIFNDTIYEITMWDIENLTIKTRILVDWNYIPESIKISNDEELLLVCARNEEIKKTRFYSFSIETGINYAFFETQMVIDRFHLIASSKAERLLYIGGEQDKQYNLMDPYSLTNPIDANDLFEKIEENFNQIQEPYIIRSDKIIYFIDGKMSIKKLVPDNSDDWIKCLREELRDDNSITTPSKKTIDIITEIIQKSNYEPERKEFVGKFLKWKLEPDDNSVLLTVVDYNFRRKKWNNTKKQLDILPSLKNVNSKDYILHCEILDNDDLITITRIGVIIWTYRLSKIKMHYYWSDCNDRLDDFVFEKIKLKILIENLTSGRILPDSSYETICKNLDIKFGDKELFNEFLDDNIKEDFYLICYGKFIMETLILLKDEKMIRCLGVSCMDKFVQEKNHVISKISLLGIIFEKFKELSENHPAFIASILSLIGFVVTSNNVKNSFSSHISAYGGYYHLSITSFQDILFSNFWNRWISFQEAFQNWFQNFQKNHPRFRDLIVKHVIEFYNYVVDFYYVNHNTTILAIPLPNFVSYPKKYNYLKELFYPEPNLFSHSKKFEKIDEEFYRYLNGEALLEFKWNTYGRKYYFLIWATYTIFLGSFIIVSSFSDNISWFCQQIFLYTDIVLGFWHLFVEFRQFLIYSPMNYLLNLAATLSTIATSIYWLKNGSAPTWPSPFQLYFLK